MREPSREPIPSVRLLGALGLLIAAAACGAQQEAKEPETPPAGESAPSEPVATDEPPPGEGSSEPHKEEPPLRTPRDIVTGEGVLFMFAFSRSEAREKADQQCTAKSGDDPQKKAECMTKASDKFDADGMAFQKDSEDKWWWLTIRRKGSSLITLHKIEFDFGEETDRSITIKPKGRDKGTKPMSVPKQVVIEVPDESHIAVVDPKHGRMVYEAKLGLLEQPQQ
jgi:hypothetical protein